MFRACKPRQDSDNCRREVIQEFGLEGRGRELLRRNAETGNEPGGGTPAEFAALIASDSQKWGDVIKRAGIKLE